MSLPARTTALSALLLVLSAGSGAAQGDPRVGPPDDPRRSVVVEVVERVSPAVVNIAAEAIVREADPFFGDLLFGRRARRAQSLGSGLVVEPNGIVVTNAHVIEGASRIVVTTLGGRELEAEVLGSDRDADLAVLRVATGGEPLAAVPLAGARDDGRARQLYMGETVLAIGNPFGLAHTVTSGVLSGRGRSVPSERGELVFTDFLQTDASINPGNSGGPLVNLEGEVIGINTAIVSGAAGIGFAIPSERALRVVEDLLRYGELRPVWTGLKLLTVSPELARRADLPSLHGALVRRVVPGSPAERAGLVEGDLLVAIGGEPIQAREDLTTALYSIPLGTPVALEVLRGDERRTLRLVGETPEEGQGLDLLAEVVGIELETTRERLVVTRVRPGSPAAQRGLRPGDVVLAANGQRATGLEVVGREVLRSFDRGSLLLVVGRGRAAYNLGFEL